MPIQYLDIHEDEELYSHSFADLPANQYLRAGNRTEAAPAQNIGSASRASRDLNSARAIQIEAFANRFPNSAIIGLTPAFAVHSPFGVNLLVNQRRGSDGKMLAHFC
jgi:hypothetical protein